MGFSSWSADTYASMDTTRRLAGKSAFTYNDDIIASIPVSQRKVHEDLDPKDATRESRDSEEHPNSNAIAVWFDVTGSMSTTPRRLQENLGQLMSVLVENNCIDDPQVQFGAVGDAYSDRGPCQAGQFESGLEMDADLGKLWLEGGGGGGNHESYDLAMYFMAHKTNIDCFDKRGKKGYFFLMADEVSYTTTDKSIVKKVFGDTPQADIPLAETVAALKERYNFYVIFPNQPGMSNYVGDTHNHTFWRDLVGQNFILLDDATTVAQTIAVAIGLNEGRLTADQATKMLQEHGSSKLQAEAAVRSAVATTPVGAASAAL
jgi:hypothetical protein